MSDPTENEDIETLRNQIWDFVYRQGEPQMISTIMNDLQLSDACVRRATHHDWFVCEGDSVAIA